MSLDTDALQRLPEQNPAANGLRPPPTWTCTMFLTDLTSTWM
ncbi:hypothetical protein OG589_33745 [Sphaerisporangium sp. NBC_01403]